jgi:biopolymer transport protein ExbD
MMDLTFLLLIFFLVTTTFERAEGVLESAMPAMGEAAGVPLPITPIVIRLTPDLDDPLDYDLTVERFSDAPARLDGLTAFLRDVQNRPGFDADTPVVIVGDDEVAWDHVVGCWNAALAAGCTTIAFAEP